MGKQRVNYIKQLNNFQRRYEEDERITQKHFVLYMVLFFFWNNRNFARIVTIHRERIMDRALISSKTTYHGAIRDLHTWGYLIYYPSQNPSRGSRIQMIVIGTTPELQVNKP